MSKVYVEGTPFHISTEILPKQPHSFIKKSNKIVRVYLAKLSHTHRTIHQRKSRRIIVDAIETRIRYRHPKIIQIDKLFFKYDANLYRTVDTLLYFPNCIQFNANEIAIMS